MWLQITIDIHTPWLIKKGLLTLIVWVLDFKKYGKKAEKCF